MMKPMEVQELVEYVERMIPAQRSDEETSEAWLLALGDLNAQDVWTATRRLVLELDFVGPKDIIAGVSRIREDRMSRATFLMPNDITDPAEFMRILREKREAIYNGEWAGDDLEPPSVVRQERGQLAEPVSLGDVLADVHGQLAAHREQDEEGGK